MRLTARARHFRSSIHNPPQACQIAKLKGCKVIAIAGGAAKCKFLKEEIGCDAVLDYKSTDFKRDFRDTVGYLDVRTFFSNSHLTMCLRFFFVN